MSKNVACLRRKVWDGMQEVECICLTGKISNPLIIFSVLLFGWLGGALRCSFREMALSYLAVDRMKLASLHWVGVGAFQSIPLFLLSPSLRGVQM